MLNIKGKTGGEYFNITCAKCGSWVSLSNLRWLGGVPQVVVRCTKCNDESDLKLHPPTWIDITPPSR